MIKPTIHMNGSDPNVIARAYKNAADAIGEASEAWVKASPHPRDYSPEDYTKAHAEHTRYLAHLSAMIDHADALYLHCIRADRLRRQRREAAESER